MRLPLLVALLTLALGLPFIGMTGMHMDAALEVACLYPCSPAVWGSQILGKQVPWMAMTYLGAIKALLFAPLLAGLPATLWTLRLPLLLLASGSVALFAMLLQRVAGQRAAIAGSLLLAADASFVLSSSIDFGPVVGLHFLWLAGVLLLLRFERTGRLWVLALAFFCFGLALWHKALFLWMLGGLGVAGLAAFPRRIWQQITAKRLGVATAAMILGCLPLLIYNIRFPLRTFRIADVAGEASPLSHKWLILNRTLDGTVMLGFLNEEAWPETRKPPATPAAKASVAISETLGFLPTNTVPWFALAAALLSPWLLFTGARQGVIFCWVYLGVVWAQMALVGKTGGSIHHVLLLWPVPQMLLVLAGGEVAARWRYGIWVGVAGVSLILTGNLLLLNQYFADLATKGTGMVFTDAVEPLRARLEAAPEQEFITVDWGYHATLCLQSKGHLPVTAVDFDDRVLLTRWISQPATLFLAHSPEAEQVTGVHERLQAVARQMGYVRRISGIISDRNGRPRFELWRFQPLDTTQVPAKVDMSKPAQESLMRGMWEIEADGWRWSSQRFAFRLAPATRPNTDIVLQLHFPDVIFQKLGPLTLSVQANGHPLETPRLIRPGDQVLRWPAPAPGGQVLEVTFTLDKALPPAGAETRELGIIVRGIGLETR